MPEADYTKGLMYQAIGQTEDTAALLRQSSGELASLGAELNRLIAEVSKNQQLILRTISNARAAQATADMAIAGTSSLKVSNGIRALAKVDAEQTNDVLRLAQLKRSLEDLIREVLNAMQTTNRETQAQTREAISEFRAYVNIL